MIPAPQFLDALRAKAQPGSIRLRWAVSEFIVGIHRNHIYTPGDHGFTAVELVSLPTITIDAFYFAIRFDDGKRMTRLSLSGALPGELSGMELQYLQEFTGSARAELLSQNNADPHALVVPPVAPAMVLLTSTEGVDQETGRLAFDHDVYLLLHTSLEPLIGLELIHSSMRHWHDVQPEDRAFYIQERMH